MAQGVVFDIKEFAVHDGPGLRTTVFLKGCPINCTWCHNPEGKSCLPGVMHTAISERKVGRYYSPDELAKRLNKYASILRSNEGGVTFSGGEPLLQTEFLVEVIDRLDHLHVLLDTSGYGSPRDFILLAKRSDLVYFDLKLMDPVLFHRYTGGDIRIVLKNLKNLSDSGTPFVIRVPLVPGVTDTEQNLFAIAHIIKGMPRLERVDLLPYNRLAGAKYEAAGIKFKPDFDETQSPNLSGEAFENAGIKWRVV
jgi:pyruvate formate lyase activating enzyme